MPISPADFVFSLAPDPLQAVIGFNTTAQFSFSNTNLVDKAFNLSLTATLPDGVSFVSSDGVPTQIINNPGGTITLTWISLKDLAPNELNYILGVTLKSDNTFRATGLLVPFDVPLVTVSAAAPLTGIPITYGGTVPAPLPPVTIDPHGLRWNLGNLPANSTFSATFRVQVENVDFVGSLNNLGKLSGNNTAGLAYSGRDQVPVKFGALNITLTKNVIGPDVNAIKAGKTYTYSITIANPQNATNTTVDASDIDLTDIIPTGLTYVPGSISVAGTGTFNPPQRYWPKRPSAHP